MQKKFKEEEEANIVNLSNRILTAQQLFERLKSVKFKVEDMKDHISLFKGVIRDFGSLITKLTEEFEETDDIKPYLELLNEKKTILNSNLFMLQSKDQGGMLGRAKTVGSFFNSKRETGNISVAPMDSFAADKAKPSIVRSVTSAF